MTFRASAIVLAILAAGCAAPLADKAPREDAPPTTVTLDSRHVASSVLYRLRIGEAGDATFTQHLGAGEGTMGKACGKSRWQVEREGAVVLQSSGPDEAYWLRQDGEVRASATGEPLLATPVPQPFLATTIEHHVEVRAGDLLTIEFAHGGQDARSLLSRFQAQLPAARVEAVEEAAFACAVWAAENATAGVVVPDAASVQRAQTTHGSFAGGQARFFLTGDGEAGCRATSATSMDESNALPCRLALRDTGATTVVEVRDVLARGLRGAYYAEG